MEALVGGLSEAGLLARYHTCLAFPEAAWWMRLLPRRVSRQLGRRSAPLPADKIVTRPWRELVRLALAGHGGPITAHESGWASVDAVYHDLDRSVARTLSGEPKLRGVYAYEDGALATFRRAEEMGLARIYDLPIGYWRASKALLAEEAERRPEWAATLMGNRDSEAKLARKDEELARATMVVVASRFTRQTLRMAPLNPGTAIRLVPYGAPPPCARAELEAKLRRPAGAKLRALFVGGLSQRKGIAEVFAAAEVLRSELELTVIGRPPCDCAALSTALKSCRHLPSLPHDEILREMRGHDVLLFPSLFEGFGLVILEAMAQGTPVISTPHTAGPDVMRDGVDGFIVPIRDADAIVARLLELTAERARLGAMSLAAWQRAGEFTWQRYRTEVVTAVQEACDFR